MATLKQCRYHYAKIARARYALSKALNDAHTAKVIDYKDGADSPCDALWECWERVQKTTSASMATALREDIMKGVRGY